MKEKAQSIFISLIGNFIQAFAVAKFLLPYNILTGGCSGIAILIAPYVSIEKDILVTIMMVVLYIIGFIFLGKVFAINTALVSIVYPLLIIVIGRVFPPIEVEPLYASLYGGLFWGIGIGMIFSQGGSTGGMDIPPLIIHKYFHYDLAKIILLTDTLTVGAGLLIYSPNAVLLGLISVYATSFGIEKTMSMGGIKAKKIEIISEYYEKIIEGIHNLERGTTLVEAQGGFTGNKKKMIVTVVYERQFQAVIDLIDSIDKEAFVIVSNVKDVHGEGFSYKSRI